MLVRQQQVTGHQGAIYGLCSGETGTHLYTAGGDGWVVRWDLAQPDPGVLIARAETQLFALTLLREPQMLVAGSMSGGLHWIDLQDSSRNRDILHHRKGTFALAAASDGLYSGGGDGLLSRWDLPSMRATESLVLSRTSVRCLALQPGTTLLAAGCSDGHIYLVDLAQWKVTGRIQDAHLPSVFGLVFSPDGRYLWSGGRDAQLRCWDMHRQQEKVQEIAAHWFTLNALATDPDGRWLATASRDKTIRIWELATGQLLQTLETVRDQGHRNSVNNLLWHPWGSTLVSVSDDRSLILWREK